MIKNEAPKVERATGALRESKVNKGRFDLISPHALRRLAIHYELGAEVHAPRNWEKGLLSSECFSSAVRHLFQWIAGMRDEDHLAAAVWNIFCIMHFEEVKSEMIDTPTMKGGNCYGDGLRNGSTGTKEGSEGC